ncbi:MAG TPA: amino-acid N-acetyltransferase [Candidatus Methylacidiphilales bacterium]|jgi:amino-acid N-acetyltransferase|nr:amino-acid N-acetyltransferase [Candidatus Methylacidiphilales bacterium]
MKVSDLRGILTYIPGFREKTFVIALDGAIIADDNLSNIMLDLAVLRSLSIRLVIVHGAAHQILELAKQSGVAISNADGTGITDAETLKLALTAANRITHEVLEGLASNDLRAAYTNAVIAHPYGIVGGVDQLFTGRVERVDTEFLTQLLDKGVIPVIAPLGFDGDGRTFRVNSDGVALEVAEALKASKLIFVTNRNGFTKNGQKVSQISVAEAEEFFKKHRSEIPDHMASKFEHSIRACRNGVSRVHVIDGRIDEALLTEIFSNEGIGSMIYANEYQAVRRAMKKDVRAIRNLIRESVEQEELVKRTRVDIVSQLNDYYVFQIDGNIVGCVALHVQPDGETAELACLSVSGAHENMGIGQKLMTFAEEASKQKGIKSIFLLSTRAFNYFQQKGGYKEGSPADLPPARREKYDASGRNSKVLVKQLV